MPRTDLTTSIRSAMTAPGVAAAVAADASQAAPGPAAPPPAPRPGSLRGRLFGRIADYARRYLTASVEHRITLMQTDLGEIRGRTDRIDELLSVVHRMEGLVAAHIGYTSEHREVLSAQI